LTGAWNFVLLRTALRGSSNNIRARLTATAACQERRLPDELFHRGPYRLGQLGRDRVTDLSKPVSSGTREAEPVREALDPGSFSPRDGPVLAGVNVLIAVLGNMGSHCPGRLVPDHPVVLVREDIVPVPAEVLRDPGIVVTFSHVAEGLGI